MFFTNTGRVYSARVHETPDLGRTSKGRSIANMLELQPGEKIAELIRVESVVGENGENLTWKQPYNLLFATRKGQVKKTALEDFGNIRKGGIIAISINEGDYLIEVKLTQDTDNVVLITRQGKSIRFAATDARRMGRKTAGVRGISLAEKDEVVSLEVVDNEASLLVVGERGIGKRTGFGEYRVQTRGGKGIITMKTSEKTGELVGALTLGEDDELMLMSSTGQMIRIKVNGIRLAGRNTQGVKLVNLSPKESVIAIAPVRNDEDGEASDGEDDDEIENENENETEIISSEEEGSTLADESDDGAS
jgi:DNA gyrase subunit A